MLCQYEGNCCFIVIILWLFVTNIDSEIPCTEEGVGSDLNKVVIK